MLTGAAQCDRARDEARPPPRAGRDARADSLSGLQRADPRLPGAVLPAVRLRRAPMQTRTSCSRRSPGSRCSRSPSSSSAWASPPSASRLGAVRPHAAARAVRVRFVARVLSAALFGLGSAALVVVAALATTDAACRGALGRARRRARARQRPVRAARDRPRLLGVAAECPTASRTSSTSSSRSSVRSGRRPHTCRRSLRRAVAARPDASVRRRPLGRGEGHLWQPRDWLLLVRLGGRVRRARRVGLPAR